MAVRRRVRFEVFKRDGFCCQYCGKGPPAVLLELDHIIPRHPIDDDDEPGSDDEDNLLTSCRDCNAGKSNIPLGTVRPDVKEKLAELQEREEQLREYQILCESREARLVAECNEVDSIYSQAFPGWVLSDGFKRNSVRRFLAELPKLEVMDAMTIAVYRIHDRDKSIRYFCVICWSKIRGGNQS